MRNHLNIGWCRESRPVLSLSLKISNAEELPSGLFSPHNWYCHLVGHKLLPQCANFLTLFREIFKQKWHNIFIISTWVRKSIPPAIQCRSNLCSVHFLDADLGSFSGGNASVPLHPSASKRCLQCDHAAGTASFYQGLEGVIVTRPVLQIKNSCISNDCIICKIF